MKRQFLILIAIAVFATALTTNAFGQTGKTVKANVKFDFQIGERIYPAGEYWIELISDNILLIRSAGDPNKKQILLANHSIWSKGQTPRLLFQKSGQDYFLTKVFLDTDRWGYSIRPSRRQRKSGKNLALASLETIEVPLAK